MLITPLDDLSVYHKHRNERRRFLMAGVLSNCVVTARQLHKALSNLVDLGRIPVHAAQHLAVGYSGHDGRSSVTVRRRVSCGGEMDFESDDGFPWCVLKLVVIQQLKFLPRSSSVQSIGLAIHSYLYSLCDLPCFFSGLCSHCVLYVIAFDKLISVVVVG